MEAATESNIKPGTAQEADRGHGGPGPTDPEREYEGNQEPGSREETNRKEGITGQEIRRGHDAGGATEVTEKGSETSDPEQDYGTNHKPQGPDVSGTDQEHTTNNQERGPVEVTNHKNTTSGQEFGSAIVTDRDHATINQEPVTTTVTNQGHATTNQEHGTATATNQEHATTNQEPVTTTVTNQGHATTNQEHRTATVINQEHATTNQEPGAADVTDQDYATSNQEPDFSDYTGISQEDKESKVTISEENTPLKLEESPEVAVSSPGTSERGMTPEEMKNDTEKKDPDTGLYHDMAVKPLEGHEAIQDDLGALENEDGDPPQEQGQWQQEPEDEKVREAVIEQYQTLVSEREKVLQHNAKLQHKLYEYFRRKKGDESRPETEKHVEDQEQHYLKSLATLEEMRKKYREDAASHQQQIEELKVQCEQVVSQVDKEWAAFQEQKKKTALYLVNRGGGRHATSCFNQELDQLQSKEERKEKEVIQVRLENIKIKNQIHCYESTMRSKEELADGLHLIDFEQLKIENQTYNEKIEERNEELLKLKKKISNTVQVLTHVKEKLQFVQAENQEQKERLMEIEALVAHKRDILTKTKQARDSLRMDNLNLKQKCGLLGNKTLLRDFEHKVDATEELSQKLESLKRHHADLTLSSKGIMKKIEEAKSAVED